MTKLKVKIAALIFQYVRVSIAYLIFIFSFIIPRNKNIWIFIGWRRIKEREIFAENTKYFFLHAHNELKGIRPIWIGMDSKICKILRDNDYEAYPLNSFFGIWYSLRAGYTFLGGLLQLQNWKFTGRTKVIQLWHGKSVKKTGFNSAYGLTRYARFLNPNLFRKFDKFVAISNFLSDFITTDFQVPKESILVTGMPKHDAMISTIKGSQIDLDNSLDNLITSIRSKQSPRRLYLYGPTFRPDGTNPLSYIDLENLDSALRTTGDAIIMSLHPKFAVKNWAPEAKKLTNIYFSENLMDIYPILHKFDALITDYSSLIVDFIYLNKPTIVFAYDFEKYQSDMGVYEELWKLMPGPKVHNFDDFINSLSYEFTSPEHIESINLARKSLFDFYDANASKRIAEKILLISK